MTIHTHHPFRDPSPDPLRQLRGRLGGAVSLWTAPGPAGLTVSSLLVAAGEPSYVVGLLDPDSDLAEALEREGRGVVQLLQWRHRGLAEAFAGVAPAPGGPFAQAAFDETPWGPRLADAHTWVGVVTTDARDVGWSREVTCRVEHLAVAAEDEPLEHRRGRYLRPRPDAGGP
jgi:flavin reductase (DIM6/NTAB) family NADH-FMN oxidoreductase RutF